MLTRKIWAPISVFVLILFIFSLTAPIAVEAACGSDVLTNSNGSCVVSYRYGETHPYAYQYQFQNRYYDNREDTIRSMISWLQDMIDQLEEGLGDDSVDGWSGSSDVSVSTLSAADIGVDEVTLKGRVYTGNEDEVTVYFEYGSNSSNLSRETTRKVVDEPSSTYTFSTRISGLNEDTRYYYRAVAEDESGDEDKGSVYNFYTDNERRSGYHDDEPDVYSRNPLSISDDSAELRGIVDMNDFNNGLVFFVYGEDEYAVDDVEDDYEEYADIDEEGDDLQKVKIDNNLDGSENYTEEVVGLDNDTEIFYSICVEYNDKDDDSVIVCSGTESFYTDE